MIIASQVTIVEMAPVIARLPDEKMAPMSGAINVVPQVGQPAPSAINPVMMPALLRFSESLVPEARFLPHNSTMSPMRMPCKMEIAKTGSQSRNG